MADKSNIEWTDATWNVIVGCSRVSEGCRHCYAERVAARQERLGTPQYQGLTVIGSDSEARWNGTVRLVEGVLGRPLRWKRPRKIFVNAMSDLFHENVPDEWIDTIFAVMALCPQHTFQILTKRPERMLAWFASNETPEADRNDHVAGAAFEIRERLSEGRKLLAFTDEQCLVQPDRWPLPNVWLGVSVEDQRTADERIPLLLQTPAAVRWISAEPLLGPVDLEAIEIDLGHGLFGDVLRWHHMPYNGGVRRDYPTIDWVVAGGESGPGARPMHPDWVRSLRYQCIATDVRFNFKQWGEWMPAADIDVFHPIMGIGTEDPRYYALPSGGGMIRVGKRAAGRELDGRTWDEYPSLATGVPS